MGPLRACVCVEFFSTPPLYFGELEHHLSVHYSLLIRCCQPASQGGTRGLSKHSAN